MGLSKANFFSAFRGLAFSLGVAVLFFGTLEGAQRVRLINRGTSRIILNQWELGKSDFKIPLLPNFIPLKKLRIFP